MTANRFKFHTDDLANSILSKVGTHDVQLFGTTKIDGTAHIGNTVADQVQRLSANTSTVAFDLLAIALAVTAADSFTPREKNAQNGWARTFELNIPLAKPVVWQPAQAKLEKLLNFLSGDNWSLTLRGGGRNCPAAVQTNKKRKANLAGVTSVSLFSGGLDSWIGVNELLRDGEVPILISHAYTGDKGYQDRLFETFSKRAERFAVNASPMRRFKGNDTTMRTRSFNFIAFAAVAAEAIAQLNSTNSRVPIYVPENGFIALNAPLTSRRVGSLSTRTTHPHYLQQMQDIFDLVGIRAEIRNPYRHSTKGRMLKDFGLNTQDAATAMDTVSCGKWKRKNKQCGHCVPCVIRRAAFFAAGVDDTTEYSYSLHQVMNSDNIHLKDDLMSMAYAVQQKSDAELKILAMSSGPLPLDLGERDGWFDVHKKGLYEVANYLRSEKIIS
ncbi:7-cyano-7-deazaguanine synthase in queuosine biosynthesis [Ochrobactrum sp. 19YEA23]|uniref:Qat anti-phage system QueC-like protein QatC n=1 Tax=Ochrobactrum sp. 19YEA23 TaxID=3039854 RepID=UPI00247859EC|nr:7-cyano-7-deazaguanine synthase in queuosine biosynthesis [Ochrobactrum sp. 19YEA23]